MKKLLLIALALTIGSFGIVGCSQQEGAEPPTPKEGEYKTPDQVPGREGRTKAEAGQEGR